MLSSFMTENAFIWRCVWQTTACLAIGGFLSFLWMRRPARAHRLLLLAVVAALTTPLLSQAVQQLGWGMLRAPLSVVDFGVEEAAPLVPESPVSPLAETSASLSTTVPERTVPAAQSFSSTEPLVQTETLAPTVSRVDRADSLVPWTSLLLWGWLAFSGLCVVRLLVSLAEGARMVARARLVTDEALKDRVEAVASELGLRKPPDVFFSTDVRCPQIWCWRKRPALLLPDSGDTIARSSALRSVLCHELSHLKRRDHFAVLLGELLICLLPWQPLAWWSKRRLVRLSEQSCDDWALARGSSPAAYAELVLSLLPQSRPTLALTAVTSRSGLQGRIHHILRRGRRNPRAGYVWTLAAIVLTVCLAGGIAIAQTSSSPQTSSEEPTSAVSDPMDDSASKKSNALSGAMTIRKVPQHYLQEMYTVKTKDGKYAVETDWGTGNLVVRDIATGRTRNLTNKPTRDESNNYAVECSISEDDKCIVFTWYDSEKEIYTLHSVDFDGTNEKVLFEDGGVEYVGGIEWIVDGERILANLHTETKAKTAMVSLDDKAVEILTSCARPPESWPDTCLSPDRSRFVYEKARTEGDNDIYLYDIASQSETALVQHPADDQVVGWSADGKWFFFVSDRLGAPSLWGLQLSRYRKLLSPVFIHQFTKNTRLNSIGILENDVLFYYERLDIQEQYQVVMDIDTGQFLGNPQPANLVVNNQRVEDGTLSGDLGVAGRYIKKAGVNDVAGVETYSVENRYASKPISQKFFSFWGTEWSKDGRYLLCNATPTRTSENFDIYLLDDDKSEIELILRDTDAALGYAADENYFYYTTRESDSGLRSIVKRHFVSGEEEVIYSANANTFRGDGLGMSYDKNWVAFFDPTENSAKRVRLDNGNVRVLYTYPQKPPMAAGGGWTTDNRHILFRTSQGQGSGSIIWKISRDGGEPQKLRHVPDEIKKFFVETGNRVRFELVNEGESTYWAMENFVPKGITASNSGNAYSTDELFQVPPNLQSASVDLEAIPDPKKYPIIPLHPAYAENGNVENASYTIAANGLLVGGMPFTDRNYRLVTVPQELQGLTLLRTAMGNKKVRDGDFAITLGTDDEVNVFLAVDSRLLDYWETVSKPEWFRGYRPTRFTVATDDADMQQQGQDYRVYGKRVEAGKFTLGPPRGTSVCTMYFAFFGVEGEN